MPIFNDMTNKEAAKVLNDYSTVNRNASLPYINEAIHVAIKALDQIDNIKAQNAEYKTRLGIDETVVPKDADAKVEIVWYEWQEAPDVTWSSGSFTKLYGCMKQRGGEVYRITKTIYGKCVFPQAKAATSREVWSYGAMMFLRKKKVPLLTSALTVSRTRFLFLMKAEAK